MFRLNQLYLEGNDGKNSEDIDSEQKKQEEAKISMISQDPRQDITASFKALKQQMNHNQIIKTDDFILDHTMQSYQLFNPKTDYKMNIPESYNLENQFVTGILKPAEELLPSEIILLVDQLFLRETLFYRGYEPSQTINLCALKINSKYHEKSLVISAIVHAQSYLIFKLIEIVRNCFSQREDDFHAPIIHQKFTQKSSTQIVKMFLDAQKEIDGLIKAQPLQSENYKQLKNRLKFLRGTFQFIDKITAPVQFSQRMDKQKTMKQLDEKYNFIIKNCLLIEQHCQNDSPDKAKRDQTQLDFIKQYFQKKVVVNFPGMVQPKHVPNDQSKFAYKNFRQIVLVNLRRAIQIPSKFQPPRVNQEQKYDQEKDIKFTLLDFKTELLSLNIQSNYNLLVRCIAEHILFPVSIDFKRNKIDPETQLKSLKSQYSNKLLYFCSSPKSLALFNVQEYKIADLYSNLVKNIYPKVTIRKKKKKKQQTIDFSQTQHGKEFFSHFELLVKSQILRNLKSKSRQHRNCVDYFRDITIIMNQGNIADQTHQKLASEKMTNCPAINLVLSLSINAMFKHLHSMIDLDILQFSQIKHVFRYFEYCYLVGGNNNKYMMINALSYNFASNTPLDILNYLLDSQTKLTEMNKQVQYFAHQWVYFSTMSLAMKGTALIMELIYRYAMDKRVKNVRYPDPWLHTYQNFNNNDEQGKQDSKDLAIKMRKAAYNERFKVFKQLPFPKFISYQQNEQWFSEYNDKDKLLNQGKASLMKAGQIFKQMKKLQNRNKHHMSDQFLESLTRRCVLNSLNLVKLINLKDGQQIELKFQLQRQTVPLLNFQKL